MRILASPEPSVDASEPGEFANADEWDDPAAERYFADREQSSPTQSLPFSGAKLNGGRRLDGKPSTSLKSTSELGGEPYATTVEAMEGAFRLMGRRSTADLVKELELPDLPDNGDAADYVAARSSTDKEALRRDIEQMADDAAPLDHTTPNEALDVPQRFVPFPVDALPEPMRSFVADGAAAIGCDPSYIALPLLSATAAAVGQTRRLRLKNEWCASAIIWAAIIGESGTAKTPAFKLALSPTKDRERRAFEQHATAMADHEAKMLVYEKDLAQWKRSKGNEPQPEKPTEPQAERFLVVDTTVEALAPILLANPRGVLLARDELAGWIGSFDRYAGKKGGGGGDAASWLSMHSGESIIVDRKMGNPRTIYVPHAAVCISGGIQPGIFQRVFGAEHRESGLAARLLLANPPRKAKEWTEADIDPHIKAAMEQVIVRLYELQPQFDIAGRPYPATCTLTPAAKAAFIAYFDEHAKEQSNLSGDLSAAFSKLEEYAARLSLVIHLVRWAANDPAVESEATVDGQSMAAGIRLATWFKREAVRIYALMGESDDDRNLRRLVEWLERRGDPVSVRDVQQGCRWLRAPGLAEAALEQLVKTGVGLWESTPPGRRGQPTRRFRLSKSAAVNGNGSKPEENRNTVDVDTVDAPNDQAEDEWGST